MRASPLTQATQDPVGMSHGRAVSNRKGQKSSRTWKRSITSLFLAISPHLRAHVYSRLRLWYFLFTLPIILSPRWWQRGSFSSLILARSYRTQLFSFLVASTWIGSILSYTDPYLLYQTHRGTGAFYHALTLQSTSRTASGTRLPYSKGTC